MGLLNNVKDLIQIYPARKINYYDSSNLSQNKRVDY